MSAYKQYWEELARRAENKAGFARKDTDRVFWTERAELHRAQGAHYDSFDRAKQRALDIAGEEDLRCLRTGIPSTLKAVSCSCTKDACYCATTRRQDSTDPEFAQRERERAQRDAMLAGRDARNAARSGVASPPAPRAPAPRAAIESNLNGGGAARQEMIRARANAFKTTR